ncbi:hypothetical protein J1N35_023932 [Gossypium stocksii]|uniref:Uncharacterized protein n=1 Tax=Gossypium stocksii TaxID=47602 RepID=A0A9D4A2J1_9ROSI|nr:hypothetical protein J1N35_023932 [Gossypium stocksii]
MKRLRLLKVLCASNCEDLKYLSNELRLLDWKGCPLRSLPSSFQPDNLVALLLPYSRIEQLWKGNRPLYKLKIINLEGSQNLIKTPDLTTASRLEVLILEGCTRLVDVHPSVGVLKSLKLLNLKDCISLKSLPTIIGMESLETLILSGCSSLVRFPGIDRKMERLKTLDISGCYRVEILPGNLQSFNGCERASKLQRIALSLFKLIRKGWTNSKAPMLPSLPGLSSLRKLKLRDCNLRERDIPRDFSCLLARKAKGRHKTTHQAGSHEQGETSLRVSVDDIPQREYTEEEEEKEDKIDEDTPSPQYYNFDEAFVPKRPSTKGVVLRSPTRGKRPRQSSGRVYRRVAGKKHKGKKVVESESESDEDF